MSFGEYIWSLLPLPFRKVGSDIYLLFQAIGAKLEELKQAFFQIRRAWIIDTAPGWALDLHGMDRRMPRLPGESDDVYRLRLQSARTIYAMGGTDTGLIESLAQIGFTATIYNLYNEDPLRWAEMNITAQGNISQPLSLPTIESLKKTLKVTKAAHAKIAILILSYRISTRQNYRAKGTETMVFNQKVSYPPGNIILDGSKVLDGSWQLNSKSAAITITSIPV
ncbi:MAG: phage tail protein [Peptococcaceae bacterium]|jgi:hypothetical protein|nr:phage tail protein [Peptococcaceae bacterium]